MIRTPLVCLALCLLLLGSAWAHHAPSATFDMNDRTAMTGTLVKIDWRNPHIELVVETKSGDQVQTWSLEGPPPMVFRPRNINKSDFEAALGKTVTFEVSRARDGSSSGLLRVMTLPGNKVVSTF